jgi:hypothetical protein
LVVCYLAATGSDSTTEWTGWSAAEPPQTRSWCEGRCACQVETCNSNKGIAELIYYRLANPLPPSLARKLLISHIRCLLPVSVPSRDRVPIYHSLPTRDFSPTCPQITRLSIMDAEKVAPAQNVQSPAESEHEQLTTERPTGWKYRERKIGPLTIPWYASPEIQLLMVAFVCFLCPGKWSLVRQN